MHRSVEQIAKTAHEVNRALCIGLGDNSQLPWEDAPEWQRVSALNGVIAILKDPSMTPERSHEGWMREKIEGGWVYGDVKDPENKTHPCIVPYSDLPRDQQAKDTLFTTVVRALL